MKKILFAFAAFAALLSSCRPAVDDFPQVYAHRGCHLDGLIPENSLSGIAMAARFGYPAIEMDVKYTLDSVLVIMHDGTINRTMRLADGYAPIPEPVRVSETSFQELRTKYVLASEDPSLREPIPTLVDMLAACKRCGIHPVLHSHIDLSYKVAQELMGDDWTCFSSLPENVAFARSFSQCKVLLDPGRKPAAECVEMLRPLGGWLGMSTMKYDMLDSAYIAVMHEAGMHTQSSIFPVPHDADAIRDKADIILSDFCWLQTEGRTPMMEKKARRVAVKAGGNYGFSCPEELEYGAIVLEFRFAGEGQVTVDGEAVYPISSETEQSFLVGYRSLRTAPSFDVKAGDKGLVLKGLRARFYRI